MKDFGDIDLLSKDQQKEAKDLLLILRENLEIAEQFAEKAFATERILKRRDYEEKALLKEDQAERYRKRLVDLFSKQNIDKIIKNKE